MSADIELKPIVNFNEEKTSSKNDIESLQRDITQVQQTLHTNIEKVLDNIDQADELEQKTRDMSRYSKDFSITSKKAKHKMCWKSTRANVCIAMIVVSIIYFFYSEFS